MKNFREFFLLEGHRGLYVFSMEFEFTSPTLRVSRLQMEPTPTFVGNVVPSSVEAMLEILRSCGTSWRWFCNVFKEQPEPASELVP